MVGKCMFPIFVEKIGRHTHTLQIADWVVCRGTVDRPLLGLHTWVTASRFKIHKSIRGIDMSYWDNDQQLKITNPNAPWCWCICQHLPKKSPKWIYHTWIIWPCFIPHAGFLALPSSQSRKTDWTEMQVPLDGKSRFPTKRVSRAPPCVGRGRRIYNIYIIISSMPWTLASFSQLLVA